MGTGITWTDETANWHVRAGADTRTGNYRAFNEDRVLLDDDLPLAVVLDGMGGPAVGARAAELSASAIRDYLRGTFKGTDPAAALAGAFRAANATVGAWQATDPANHNGGATAVAALVGGGRVHVAWAGDARAVLVRGGTVVRLTRDHNLARALVEAGTISEAEAAGLSGGFRLWLYLGRSATEFRSDATAFDPRPGDRLVLATDGAANLLDDAALCAIVAAAPDPTSCAEAVVELAVATGSRDNCTCAVLAFDAFGDAPAERPLPEPQGPAHAPRRWWQFWK